MNKTCIFVLCVVLIGQMPYSVSYCKPMKSNTCTVIEEYKKSPPVCKNLAIVPMQNYGEHIEIYKEVVSKLEAELTKKNIYSKVKVVYLPSEVMSKKDSVIVSKRQAYQSLVPNRTEVEVGGIMPDIFLFMEGFGCSERSSFKMETFGMSSNGTFRSGPMEITLTTIFFTWNLWDNRQGRFIAFGEVQYEIENRDLKKKKGKIVKTVTKKILGKISFVKGVK